MIDMGELSYRGGDALVGHPVLRQRQQLFFEIQQNQVDAYKHVRGTHISL